MGGEEDMKTLLCSALVFVFALAAIAEDVDLMTRYVITSSRVNQLTGAVTSESRDAKLVRSKLRISKHTQDGTAHLVFTGPSGEGNDTSEESVALVAFDQQIAVLATLKDALAKMTKANNAAKTSASSEVLWNPNERLSLTLVTQTKTPKAFVELQVDTRTYVIRTTTEFEKLMAAVKAVK
jgi:hypothetical protein